MPEKVEEQPHSNERILNELIKTGKALREDHFWRNLIRVAGFVLGIFMLFVSYQGYRTSSSNNKILDRFEECTTPSKPGDTHECFEEGQVRTAQAVAQIVYDQKIYTHTLFCTAVPDCPPPPEKPDILED